MNALNFVVALTVATCGGVMVGLGLTAEGYPLQPYWPVVVVGLLFFMPGMAALAAVAWEAT